MTESINAIYRLGIPHNKLATRLPDGTQYPDFGQEFDNRPGEFHRHFNRVRDKDWADCSFLDLGCSEGSTTLRLSERNSTVYGVEGRADGIERAKTLRDILGFEKTHFSVGNVNDASSYRAVDGIFNAGVLYHLDDPVTCLERCAANARLFLYIDTGHLPRNDEGWRTARFAPGLGKPYQVKAHGVALDVADFAEPSKPELQNGMRRGPRSSIGNSTSLWLAHHSLVKLMAKLGFPHHEVLRDVPSLPRLRTAFFRSRPRPVEELGPVTRPLPPLASDAVQRTRARDIAYLVENRHPVIVIGREPVLSAVQRQLRKNRIEIARTVRLPDNNYSGGPSGKMLRKVASQRDPNSPCLVVAAVEDPTEFGRLLVRFDGYDYVFSSFAMSAAAAS